MGFVLVALSIWTGINVYIGMRGWQAFSSVIPAGFGFLYWVLFILFASSFMLARFFQFTDSTGPGAALDWLGAYSVAIIFYSLIFLLAIDLVRLLDHWFKFIPEAVKPSPLQLGLIVLCLLVGLLGYGTWNAWHPVVQEYHINIPKETAGKQELRVAMLSDLHLGNIVSKERLSGIVEQIKPLKPDLVLLAGDVIDDSPRLFAEQNMGGLLQELDPSLGIYMVLGNHDGRAEETVPVFQAAGITVLQDAYQLVDGRFYLVGRNDGGHRGMPSNRRAELTAILEGVDHQRPIILLDHSPMYLEEARLSGVDLQLSGHTHQGQMYPLNLVTRKMYETDWGYLRKDNLQVIVSTGVGTWGPPIRVGNRPEIVSLRITFDK